MKSIIITAAAVLSLTSGAFAGCDNDSSTYISNGSQSATPATMQGSASITIPVAAKDGSDFVQTLRDR